MSAALMQKIPFNNGLSFPALGFGTWRAGPGVLAATLKEAVKAGFRHIDCARVYRNEKEIGEVLKEILAQPDVYGVKREDLFITSKLWNHDHAPVHVAAAARRSLSDLGLDHLDLYLVHWPVAWTHNGADELFPVNAAGGADEQVVPLEVTWAAMEQLVDQGLVKSIGVSNFNEKQLRSLLPQCRIKPVTNQIEVHAGLPQNALRAVHAELGLTTTAYCPLGIGSDDPAKGLIADPIILELAKHEGRTPADFLLRFTLHLGCATLSKSVTPDRIRQNANIDMKPLSAATLAALATFAQEHGRRVCNPGAFYRTKGPFFPDRDSA
jgi:alcohol dehydrogenase (NADP+)